MSVRNIIIRYCIMLPGLFLLSFGIAVITKAGLGTSPISSIPYSLSLIFPRFTMGTYTGMVNACLVAAQWIMLRGKTGEDLGRGAGKAITWSEIIIQFIISFAMGYCIDLSLLMITWLHPAVYWLRVLTLLAGICFMAIGIHIQLIANVAMAPGDAFVRSLTIMVGKPYGLVRVISDSTMVAIAAVLCIVFLHNLSGVREGTIVCALLTGNIVRMLRKWEAKLPHISS